MPDLISLDAAEGGAASAAEKKLEVTGLEEPVVEEPVKEGEDSDWEDAVQGEPVAAGAEPEAVGAMSTSPSEPEAPVAESKQEEAPTAPEVAKIEPEAPTSSAAPDTPVQAAPDAAQPSAVASPLSAAAQPVAANGGGEAEPEPELVVEPLAARIARLSGNASVAATGGPATPVGRSPASHAPRSSASGQEEAQPTGPAGERGPRKSWSPTTSSKVLKGSVSQHDLSNTVNVSQVLSSGEFRLKPLVDVVPLEQLQGLRLEDGIDATRKEDYLSTEEFAQVFGSTREEFAALPRWRQSDFKKKAGLY